MTAQIPHGARDDDTPDDGTPDDAADESPDDASGTAPGDDDGTVLRKQLHRWKGEGGALHPDD